MREQAFFKELSVLDQARSLFLVNQEIIHWFANGIEHTILIPR